MASGRSPKRISFQCDLTIRVQQDPLYVCAATVHTLAIGRYAKKEPPEISNLLLSDKKMYKYHVMCHRLSDIGESLQYQYYTQAVLLVNDVETESDTSPKLPSGFDNEIPAIVIDGEHGNVLLDMIQGCHGHDNLKCTCTVTYHKKMEQGILKRAIGFINSLTGSSQQRPLIDELHRVIFRGENLRQMTSVQWTRHPFQKVCEILWKHQWSEEHINDALKKILRHLREEPDTFKMDFPFYVILCYLLGRMNCGDINVFVGQCKQWFEDDLTTNQIAETLQNFIRNSVVMSMQISVATKRTQNTANVLGDACLNCLDNKWVNIKKRGLSRDLRVRYLKAAMKWITVALKSYQESQTECDASQLWSKHITSLYLPLTSDIMDVLLDGIHFGQELGLEEVSRFEYTSIPRILNRSPYPRHFHELRDALKMFKPLLYSKYSRLVADLRKSHERAFKSRGEEYWSIACISRATREDALSQGFDLVLSLKDPKLGTSEITAWVSFLLTIVDFRKKNVVRCIQNVLDITHKDPELHDTTLEELFLRLEQGIGSLDLQTITHLYASMDIWPPNFLKEFVMGMKVPRHAQLTDEPWKLLMNELAKRFPGAYSHHFFMKILKELGSQYGDKKTFISHLLLVKADIFNKKEDSDSRVQEELKSFLIAFIQKNKLPHGLFRSQPLNTMAWQDHMTELHSILLEAVALVVVPKEVYNLEKPSAQLQDALNLCVECLCSYGNMRLVVQDPTAYQVFCWQLTGNVFAQLSRVTVSLKWIKRFSSVLRSMCKIYTCYKDEAASSEHTNVVLQPHPVAKIYFDCVKQIEDLFKYWEAKFNGKTLNYQDVMDFLNDHHSAKAIARCYGMSQIVPSEETVVKVKQEFESAYNKLCSLLTLEQNEKWQSILPILRTYRVILSQDLHQQMQRVAFPGDKLSDDFLNHQIPRGNSPIQLQLSRTLTCIELEKLNRSLLRFLEPLCSPIQHCQVSHSRPHEITHQDFLLYFCSSKSDLFRVYMETKLGSTSHEGTSRLTTALAEVFITFRRILDGSATFSDVPPALSLPTIQAEIQLLREFEGFSEYRESTTSVDIDNMLALNSLLPDIVTVVNVCDMYEELQMLKDPAVQKLKAIVNSLEDRSNLKLQEATEKLNVVQNVLHLTGDSETWKYLEIIHSLEDSTEFHAFLLENGCLGESGRDVFEQKYQLVTQQLQGEEYQQNVLDQLYVVNQYITPLFEHNQTFDKFIDKSSSLNPGMVLPPLNTVNRNIDLIKLWYSRTGEDSVEKVSSDLRQILSSGNYKITLNVKSADEKIMLQFNPKDKEEQKLFWKHQTIQDFVCKLGFLDPGEEEDHISSFLFFNQTALNLLHLFEELQDLGHQQFPTGFSYELSCNSTREHVQEQVDEFTTALIKCNEKANNLRDDFRWLLLFSSSNLKQLAELLKQLLLSDGNMAAVTLEIRRRIASIFSKNLYQEEHFLSAIEACFTAFKASSADLKEAPPDKYVQVFLQQLFCEYDGDLEGMVLPISFKTNLPEARSNAFLHKIQDSSPDSVVKCILSIYQKLPHSFQLLHCKPTTTEREVQLFFRRIMMFPGYYVFVEVNRLSSQLEEVLLKFYMHNIPELNGTVTEVHFIETAPSVLEAAPWLDDSFPARMEKDTKPLCSNGDIGQAQLVYGLAGDGKTHYIKEQLLKFERCETVVINEAFSIQRTIEKLNTLPDGHCAIHFNFTMVPTRQSVDDKGKRRIGDLMEKIGWFMFDLLALGYVEDDATGTSFTLPGGFQWNLFIEVSSMAAQEADHGSAEKSLESFLHFIPICKYLCEPKLIDSSSHPYTVDADVQLVAKYLKALESGMINKLHTDDRYLAARSSIHTRDLVKFGNEPDLPVEECGRVLEHHMPDHIKERKISQKMFIGYMKRRCEFLENFPGFYYNVGKVGREDKTKMGSTLVNAMLKEVTKLCDPRTKEDWSSQPHQQLIYEFQGGGGTIGWICLYPDQVPPAEIQSFQKLGIEIKTRTELFERETLVHYLTRALSIPLTAEEDGLSRLIDESNYVLTTDYTLKMLNINECFACGVPVIIEGETGVGKTALLEMLSKLWNYKWLVQWKKKVQELASILTGNKDDATEQLLEYLKLQQEEAKGRAGKLREFLVKIKQNPVVAVLRPSQCSFGEFWSRMESIDQQTDVEILLLVLRIILTASVSTFHKLNVHASLQPADIRHFFDDVFCQAKKLQECSKDSPSQTPKVTAYLDEINTSSCAGLFKEILVDRSIDGEPIPVNVFLVAACNPLRGTVGINLAGNTKLWHKPTYYVQQLHPTLEYLKWDYGALNDVQEKEYVNVKMTMINSDSAGEEVRALSTLILESQKHVREYSCKELAKIVPNDKALKWSRSAVSQRDMQRVFTFYSWLLKTYKTFKRYQNDEIQKAQAVLVALGLVYYMRLSEEYRKEYAQFLDKESEALGYICFTDAFKDELDWYSGELDLPRTIAMTNALKENLLANIVCCETRTPLIIIGEPGTSKTLSFNLTIENLKGKESKRATFRKTEIFPGLDPIFYQCSHHTTSNEVEKIFSIAIRRQTSHTEAHLAVRCVVFMDEAGLPEERHESLKVLHFHLDRREVSFVAITNHALDAAKTNRAITLYRPQTSAEDLKIIARTSADDLEDNEKRMLDGLCDSFRKLVKIPDQSRQVENRSDITFDRFYGQRDFIHFVNYIRRNRGQVVLTDKVVLEAVERNLNGHENFEEVLKSFFSDSKRQPEKIGRRNVLQILKDSLQDHPEVTSLGHIQESVRYKLIIDSSDDESAVRLLFAHGVLEKGTTRMYVCSEFLDESHMHINTIAGIKHSAGKGHTVLMCQTNQIHECFYELFNQRFRVTVDPKKGTLRYTNVSIRAHTKPCRVDPNFQCVVVIMKSELKNTPTPFLNRFEKYYLSYSTIFGTVCSSLPPALTRTLTIIRKKVMELIDVLDQGVSLYGYSKQYEKRTNTVCHETLYSLMLSILPPLSHQRGDIAVIPCETKELTLLATAVQALISYGGFQLPQLQTADLQNDSEELIAMLSQDEDYQSTFNSMNEEDIERCVRTAMEDLHGPTSVERESRLVIALISQWLVRYLAKRVLQLLTPEGVLKYHSRMPQSYIKAFLDCEHHFSLKAVVENQLKRLDINDWKMSACATKLVCYTRSSQYLLALPSSLSSLDSLEDEDQAQLRELVYANLENLMILKIATTLPESKLKKQLKAFVNAESLNVLLIMCNMRDISKTMINHLRILIEQQEDTSQSKRKLYVLLLHFPPTRFFDACYQALFLNGWDHFYIDLHSKSDMLNLKQCFQHCLSAGSHKTSTPSLNFTSLLPQIIPALSFRVVVGHPERAPFNKQMASMERQEFITKLFKLGADRILISLFNEYWKPSRLKKFLQEAVNFTFSRDSSLSIANYFYTRVRRSFTDFIVYMISAMNEGCTLDIVLGQCSKATQEFFLDFIPLLKHPKFADLHERSRNILRPVNEEFRFPFFHRVYQSLEHLVDECRAECQTQEVTIEDTLLEAGLYKKMTSMLQEKLEAREKEDNKSPRDRIIGTAIFAMCRSSELKDLYFNDFVQCKLRLSVTHTSFKILETYFSQLETSSEDESHPLVSWIAWIHTCSVDLKWIMAITKISQLLVMQPDSQQVTDLGSFRSTSETDLATYIITTVHSSLTTLLQSDSTTPTHLHDWKEAYQTVAQTASLYEAMQKLTGRLHYKFNHSHLTFLTLHTYTHQSLSVQVVKDLFNELEGIEPLSLRHAAPTCIKVLKPHMKPEGLQSFVEQLLSHYFFNEDSPSDPEDCKWFLKDGLDTQNELSLIQFISPSLYKFYLTKLLGSSKTIGYSPEVSRHFKPERRQLIGEVLATTTKPEMKITLANICKSLQGRSDTDFPWLVKLYLLAAMEKLDSCTKIEVQHTERAINRLSNKLKEASTWEGPLLVIEKEAVLQKLFKVFARSLCEKTDEMIADKSLAAYNAIFEKEKEHDCGLHLCFYLWKNLNSITRFRQIMTENFGTISSGGVHCLKKYSKIIPEPTLSEENHLMLIKPEDKECEVAKLYREVRSKMQEVHTSAQASLVDLAMAYSEGTLSVDFKLGARGSNSSFEITKRNAFRMCLWLCVFFEYYNREFPSPTLAEDVKKLEGQLSGEVVQLICCFVNPSEMIHEVEQETSALVDDRQRIGARNVNHSQSDPIHQFFTTHCKSDQKMKYTLANMVAVVLGCEDKKCPLWYHLFAPKELAGTFPTGYLYDRPLGGGYCYDCGVMLSEDGELQHSSGYVKRATKKIIELNAIYLLIMCNYGAFCLYLLTQRGAKENLVKGKILSRFLPIRHHCIAELNKLWLHSTVRLGQKPDRIPPEQIFPLIIASMQRLMQACYHHNRNGIFRKGEARNDYEKMWNNEVFKPSLKDSKDKEQRVTLFKQLRKMDALYPSTLDRKVFRDALGGQLASDSMPLDVLSQFSDEYTFLKAIGAILPSLVEFYQWLHTDLAYMVTRAQAGTMTIQEVVRRYPKELKRHYDELHEKVQVGYNKFVEVSSTVRFGGCGSPNTIERISKETPLLHFLSDKKEEGEGNDCLFVVMDDMIKRHNEFLTTVHNTVYGTEGYEQFKRYLPEELPFLYPAAVTNDAMIVRKESRELLEVVQSHCILGKFEFLKIQEDVTARFVAGKPKIEDPSTFLRTVYRFKEEKHVPEPTVQPFEGMLDLLKDIPDIIKEELSEDLRRMLDLQFHSADYNGLLQVALGLKMVVDQLIKAGPNEDVSHKTLPELINKLIYDEQQEHPAKELFEKIRLQTVTTAQGDSLTADQYQVFETIPAKCLYPTLEKFIQWIRDGVYDFHALPLTMKRSMSMEDEEFILGSDQHYQGELSDLREKMNNIVHAIGHSENHFRTHMGELSRESIIVILSDSLGMVDDTEKALIPQTVLVEQYVPLKICLRKLCTELERKMALLQQQSAITSQAMRWSEVIHDLWTDDGMQPTDETASVCSDAETDSEDEFSNPLDTTQEEETTIPVDIPSYKIFSEHEKEMAHSCSPDDISDYLCSLGLDRYVDAFSEEYVDGDMMLEMDEATLRQLGVVNDLDRDEILTKFKGFLGERRVKDSEVDMEDVKPEVVPVIPSPAPVSPGKWVIVWIPISVIILVVAILVYMLL